MNVECHEDHMTVTFPRAALPAVDVDNMHLLDASCGATVTDTEVTLRAGLQDCGTIQDVSILLKNGEWTRSTVSRCE